MPEDALRGLDIALDFDFKFEEQELQMREDALQLMNEVGYGDVGGGNGKGGPNGEAKEVGVQVIEEVGAPRMDPDLQEAMAMEGVDLIGF